MCIQVWDMLLRHPSITDLKVHSSTTGSWHIQSQKQLKAVVTGNRNTPVMSPSHKNPSVPPWLFQKAKDIVRWDLATLKAFISSYRAGEGRKRSVLLSVSLQQIIAPHWISKGSLVLPLIVNEKKLLWSDSGHATLCNFNGTNNVVSL